MQKAAMHRNAWLLYTQLNKLELVEGINKMLSYF